MKFSFRQVAVKVETVVVILGITIGLTLNMHRTKMSDYRTWVSKFSRNMVLIAALISCISAHAENLSPAQIKQIEEIAKGFAEQINANKNSMIDDMTVSFNAVAVGRNIRLEIVLRVKKEWPPEEIKKWLDATRAEIIPRTCAKNANDVVFNRGLSYTFAYSNAYGKKLGDVFVDKNICKTIGM